MRAISFPAIVSVSGPVPTPKTSQPSSMRWQAVSIAASGVGALRRVAWRRHSTIAALAQADRNGREAEVICKAARGPTADRRDAERF
jgi:hypothetical protein